MIPETVFSCFASVELDYDIILPTMKYYLQFGFDRYHLCLHCRRDNSMRSTLTDLLHALCDSIDLSTSAEAFDTTVRSRYHDSIRQTMNPDDTHIVADVDEWHAYPVPAPRVKDWIQRYDVVQGNLRDCWGDDLAPCNGYPLEQYYKKGDLGATLRGDLNTHQRCLTKIMACRRDVTVNSGHHRAVVDRVYTAIHNLEVRHFTYREQTMARLHARGYVSSEEMRRVARYFKCGDRYDSLIQDKAKQEQQVQQSKGWVPSRMAERGVECQKPL